MWWLKYQGTGSAIASPARASIRVAAKDAMLAPVVIATSSGSIRPPYRSETSAA